LHAVSQKQFPVLAVTALGDSGVQILLRTGATSKETWIRECDRLWAAFADLEAFALQPEYYEHAALPGSYPECEFVYVNFDVSNNPTG
jgi:hypothetical protein